MFRVISEYKIWMLLATQDIRARYSRSLIGPLWITISMTTLIMGIGILYSQIFQIEFIDYVAYLSLGILTWNYINTTIIDSSGVFVEFKELIINTTITIPMLCARVVLRNVIILFHNVLGVLIVFFVFNVTIQNVWAPMLGLLAVTAILFPVAVAVSLVSARFRDFSQILQPLLQLFFFLTPIFWQPDQIERSYFVTYNPFFYLINLIRGPAITGEFVESDYVVVFSLTFCAAILAIIAHRGFKDVRTWA